MLKAEAELKQQLEALLERARQADDAERDQPELDMPAEDARREDARLPLLRHVNGWRRASAKQT